MTSRKANGLRQIEEGLFQEMPRTLTPIAMEASASDKMMVRHSKTGDTIARMHLRNLKYWVDEKRNRFKAVSLPPMWSVVLLRNPLVVSWRYMLGVLAWVGVVHGLQHPAIGLVLNPLDNTVPVLVFGAVAFFANLFFSGASGKRTNNIVNFKSLISACKNYFSTLSSNIDEKALAKNAQFELQYWMPLAKRYAAVAVSPARAIDEIKYLLTSLLAAQRNLKRDGGANFEPRKLPHAPWVLSEIIRRHKDGDDAIVAIQEMVFRRARALRESSVVNEAFNDDLAAMFKKDKVDSLGNVDIDSTLGPPRSITVFSQFFMVLWLAYLPFWLFPIYGLFTYLAAPLSLVFYTSLMALANRIPDIYVTSADNVYSDYNLVQEIYDGCRNLDATHDDIMLRGVGAGGQYDSMKRSFLDPFVEAGTGMTFDAKIAQPVIEIAH